MFVFLVLQMKRRQLIYSIFSTSTVAVGSQLVRYQPVRASQMEIKKTSQKTSTKTDYEIIVIGAGAAGLAAARSLQDAGLFVDFRTDPHSQMAYSYVPVGGTGLRKKLAQPVDNILFFAGEATNVNRPSTVHGAIESGLRVAREILSMKSSTVNVRE